MLDFDLVEARLSEAKAIAWDTCHKIYLLMDDQQVVQMRGYGYGDANDPSSLITKDEMSSAEMFETVKKWFEESCALKFVSAVETNTADPNAGFESLIPQGAEFDEEDEDEDSYEDDDEDEDEEEE